MTRITLGLKEHLVLLDKDCQPIRTLAARVDTGAVKSSIDIKLAKKLGYPIIKHIKIRQAAGTTTRPVIRARVLIHGQLLAGEFTLIDRSKMTYRVLIGQDILKKGEFLIDPMK